PWIAAACRSSRKPELNLRSDFFRDAWHRLMERLRGQPTNRKYTSDEPPLRAELFSADQMEQHGKVLAGVHRVSVGRAPDHLLARLSENETALLQCCKAITGAVKANRRISPAGEWLLDNFYLIEEQIRTAKRHLPKVIAASCRGWRAGRRRDCRALMTSRSKRSRTATAGSIPAASRGSSPPTRK